MDYSMVVDNFYQFQEFCTLTRAVYAVTAEEEEEFDSYVDCSAFTEPNENTSYNARLMFMKLAHYGND